VRAVLVDDDGGALMFQVIDTPADEFRALAFRSPSPNC